MMLGLQVAGCFRTVCNLLHSIFSEAPSSNQLTHGKHGEELSNAATEQLLLEYLKGAEMTPRRFKETIFMLLFSPSSPILHLD